MPLQATSGAASYDAFGGGAAAVPNYIEDVFSTYLYTGTSSTQSITNNVDLTGKGGMVWIKNRQEAVQYTIADTARGAYNHLTSSATEANSYYGPANGVSFGASGFTLEGGNSRWNASTNPYASWTFRKQPKFFDIQTWTGTGANRTISHSLGSVPACIMVKRTDTTGDWQVYHRSLANTEYLVLNSTAAKATGATRWNSTTPTSTVFSIGTDATVNASGGTYVAYIFAHDAGGFGLTGTDNVISCGSYTGNGSATGPVVTLGYEPQWVLVKSASGTTANWFLYDTMRGFPTATGSETRNPLIANTTDNETTYSSTAGLYPTSTGFSINTSGANFNGSGNTYIYIAIRRGPMKVPTSGTSVFAPITATASTGTSRTVGFPADMTIGTGRNTTSTGNVNDRLRGYENSNSGTAKTIYTVDTYAEGNSTPIVYNVWNTTALDGGYWNSWSTIWWHFRRAPSFFDEVCYTGTGADQSVAHNLGVAPEFKIIKCRSNATTDWEVKHTATGRNDLALNSTSAAPYQTSTFWSANADTASLFYTRVNSNDNVNTSGRTYVAYLFATCAGVSKVFSYTGNGSSQTINCGFTAGARWILIKRTDSTGDWYVWDSARGIVSGNDPHLSLNTTAAEVTTDDTIDTDSTGFVVNQVSATNVNVSSATYIGLAIA